VNFITHNTQMAHVIHGVQGKKHIDIIRWERDFFSVEVT
jgi:hypothetical protein